MPHHAIIGRTRCGKTTLAKHLAAMARARGVCVAVLDPFSPMMHNWAADYQTHDPEKFLAKLPRLAETRRRWALFVDESSHALDRHDPRFSFLGTGAAQAGFVSYFIAQYDRQINPQVRGSVEHWWVFNNDGLDRMAKERRAPELLLAGGFPPHNFILWRPFELPVHGVTQLSAEGKLHVVLKALTAPDDQKGEPVGASASTPKKPAGSRSSRGSKT